MRVKRRPRTGGNPKDILAVQKVAIGLVPPASIIYQAATMADGARKYGPYNWRAEKVKATVYTNAALRHILAWVDREDDARDSQLPHLGHALASLGILVDAIEGNTWIDDRPARGPAGACLEKFNLKKARVTR